MKRLLLPLFVVGALAVAPARAQAPGLLLQATDDHPGRIALVVAGPPATVVTLSEVTGVPTAVGVVTLDAAGQATVPRAADWRCSERTRRFHAEGADGLAADAAVRTPGCADRYRAAVRPVHPRVGRPVTVHVTDTFRLGGVRATACARGPARVRRCGRLRLREDETRAAVRLRLPRAGAWRLAVEVGGRRRARERVRVRPPDRHRSLLATGDSMIQIVDGFLKRRLASDKVGVRSDARISTGLSKPSMFDWPRHAKAQARSLHPDVTVMFIGANDGFPFGSTQCCGGAWVKAYARRASAMMATYARHGAGSVYWNLLPAPRGARFRRVFVAVNHALRIAARRHPGLFRLVDLPKTFTPGYRFRQTIRWHASTVSVRQDDGVHLNAEGASIAATLIIRQMHRDGVL